MSLQSVQAFLREYAPDISIIETEQPTATVLMAAEVHGVAPAQIAKTLALRVGDDVILIVTRGDARLDNKKYRSEFATKPRMLPLDEVEAETGHPVGGVCPFGLAKPHRIYCDISLKAFDEVVPAAGATNAALKIAPDRMAALTGAIWIDVTAS